MKKTLLAIACLLVTAVATDGFAVDIKNIIDCFAGKNTTYQIKPFLGPIRLIELEEQGQKYHFFGVHVDTQANVDFATFKRMLLSKMGFDGKPIMQIVGDSGRFSPAGTAFGRAFIRERLSGDYVLEYGYTGYKTGGQELDANSFINEIIDEQPMLAQRVLANILGHTVVAITKWGCYVCPHVHNFVVVYNDSGMAEDPKFNEEGRKVAGFTTFGDDVTMSDFVCDRLLCLEGGAQSFLQVVNVLQQGRPVELVYNLRKPEDAKMFSAARFLHLVEAAFVNAKAPDKEQVRAIFADYVKTLNSMFNPAKPDYKTKKALFEKALNIFIDGGIFERVHALCRFYDAASR